MMMTQELEDLIWQEREITHKVRRSWGCLDKSVQWQLVQNYLERNDLRPLPEGILELRKRVRANSLDGVVYDKVTGVVTGMDLSGVLLVSSH